MAAGQESVEDHKARINRELIEFLTELRVALPGVQVLFAFLLTVPFTARFERLTTGERRVYFASIVLTSLSSALLIAPAAHHRLRFRSGNKEQLLKVGSVFAIVAAVSLALAMGAALHVVAELLYGGGVAAVTVAVVVGLTLLLWFAVPLLYARNDEPA